MSAGALAQHELSLYGGGGLSRLSSSATFRPGGHAGVGYRFYLSPRWSLGSGAEIQVYSSQLSLEAVAGSSAARDAEGSDFEFRYRAENYREDQRAAYMAVPLNVQYETGGSAASWYLVLGGKVAWNVKGSYKATVPALHTTAYYPEWNVELADPAFMGFGQWQNQRSGKKELKTATAFLLTAETGLKLKQRFYIGVYADYSLNNVLEDEGRTALIQYSTFEPTEFEYASFSTALNADGGPLLDKLQPFSAGIKVRIAFGN